MGPLERLRSRSCRPSYQHHAIRLHLFFSFCVLLLPASPTAAQRDVTRSAKLATNSMTSSLPSSLNTSWRMPSRRCTSLLSPARRSTIGRARGDRHERVVRAVHVEKRQVSVAWAVGNRLVGGDERFERRPLPPTVPYEWIGGVRLAHGRIARKCSHVDRVRRKLSTSTRSPAERPGPTWSGPTTVTAQPGLSRPADPVGAAGSAMHAVPMRRKPTRS
jgi:hypothetical protein